MLYRFLPFWLFITFFKFAGNIHYDLWPPFGEKLMPLWVVGLIMGGGAFLQVILDVPAGRIMDRFGYRKFLILTSIIFAVAGGLYLFGLTLPIYIVGAITASFGWLFFGPGINAYCLSHASPNTAGRFMSFKDVSGSIGAVIAAASLPFVLTLSPQHAGYIIVVAFICSIVGLIFSPRDIDRVNRTEKMPGQHYHIHRHFITDTIRAVKRLNPASGMLLLTNIAGATFYGAVWFVVPLVLAHQISSNLMSIGLGIFDISIIVLGFALGSIADRFNKRKLIFSGLLVFSVCAALTGLNFGWLFLIFGFMATTGDETAELSLWSWLHTLDKDHAADGAVSGVINLFNDLGWSLGPIIAGALYAWLGPSWTLVCASAPIFLLWIWYALTMKRHVGQHISLRDLPLKPHRPRHKS